MAEQGAQWHDFAAVWTAGNRLCGVLRGGKKAVFLGKAGTGLSINIRANLGGIEDNNVVLTEVGEAPVVPTTKSITYIWGKPNKVKTPSENVFYYDARGNKYYKYNDGVWDEITQEALMVPHTLFPYSHGELP